MFHWFGSIKNPYSWSRRATYLQKVQSCDRCHYEQNSVIKMGKVWTLFAYTSKKSMKHSRYQRQRNKTLNCNENIGKESFLSETYWHSRFPKLWIKNPESNCNLKMIKSKTCYLSMWCDWKEYEMFITFLPDYCIREDSF